MELVEQDVERFRESMAHMRADLVRAIARARGSPSPSALDASAPEARWRRPALEE